jgi:predicted acyl esterase
VDPSGKKEFLAKSVLRASHRALDEKRSKPWQPVHDHTKPEPCKPGEIYLFSFAFAPMARIFSPGHRIMLEITTMDPLPQIFHHKQTIQGHMPSSRPTVYRIYRDAKYQSYLLVPIIPQTPKELWIDGVELG